MNQEWNAHRLKDIRGKLEPRQKTCKLLRAIKYENGVVEEGEEGVILDELMLDNLKNLEVWEKDSLFSMFLDSIREGRYLVLFKDCILSVRATDLDVISEPSQMDANDADFVLGLIRQEDEF